MNRPALIRSRLRITILTFPITSIIAMALLLSTPGVSSARGWLGVSVQDLTSELKEAMDLTATSGALVSDVVPDGPADRAGIRARDVILSVDGHSVEDGNRLVNLLENRDSGQRIDLVVQRGDDKMAVPVVLGDSRLPAQPRIGSPVPPRMGGNPMRDSFARGGGGSRIGVRVHDIDEFLAPYFRVEPGRGVVVLDVEDDSPAAEAGVRPGDVIRRFNGQETGSAGELQEIVRELNPGDDWKAEALRDGQPLEFRGRIERGWQWPSRFGDTRWESNRPDDGGPDRADRRTMQRLQREVDRLRSRIEDLERRLERSLRR